MNFLLVLILTTDLVLTVGEGLLSTDVPAEPIFWVKGSEVDIIDSWEVEGCFLPRYAWLRANWYAWDSET